MYNRNQISWISYDFANSAYHLLVLTVLFPLLFKKVLFVGASDLTWGLVISAPIILSGIASPFIGRFLDLKNKKAIFFKITAVFTIISSLILGASSVVSPLIITAVFMLGVLTFNFSQFSYNSLLPEQSQGKNAKTSLLSGTSWGLGYLGGIICMLLIMPFIKDKELPEAIGGYETAFIIVGVFYLLFALPSLIGLKDSPKKTNQPKVKISNIFSVFKNWREKKQLWMFLFAAYLINDGLSTLVFFTSIYASETLNMPTDEILKAFLIVQVVAIPATIFISWLSEKKGYLKTLKYTIVLWVIIGLIFPILETKTHLYILSILVGMVIGTTPSLIRSILSKQFATKDTSGEIFGFHTIASRASSVVGPLLFGLIASITGNQSIAIGSVLVFFIGALILLSRINVDDFE
jgi:UMF1 family MFS transporter